MKVIVNGVTWALSVDVCRPLGIKPMYLIGGKRLSPPFRAIELIIYWPFW
jgi:hypothetical protein